MGWYARRNGDRAVLEMPTGPYDTGDELYPISVAEFHRLREEPDGLDELLRHCKNGLNDHGWWAERNLKCIVYLRGDRFPGKRAFEISVFSFERLGEAASFEEIYREYHANQ